MKDYDEFIALYPDLQKFGGLPNTLSAELGDTASKLEINGYNFEELKPISEKDYGIPIHSSAKIFSSNHRWGYVDISTEQRLFLLNLGEKETDQAAIFLEVDAFSSVIDLIKAWLIDNARILDLKNTFVDTAILDLADHEQYIKWQWKMTLLNALNIRIMTGALVPLITQAMEDPILGKLTPYTSHDRLCLSRCTDFPYSYDCPIAQPILCMGDYARYDKAIKKQDADYAKHLLTEVPTEYGLIFVNRGDEYEILNAHHQVVGVGDVFTALRLVQERTYGVYAIIAPDEKFLGVEQAKGATDLLIKALPENCGMAIRGTADDL